MEQNLQEFDSLKADLTLYVAPVMGLVVTDDDSFQKAMAAASEIKSRANRIESLRVKLKEPYLQAGKEIDRIAKGLLELLDKPNAHVKTQLLEWNKVLAERRREEERRIKEAEEQARKDAQKILDDAKAESEFSKALGMTEEATKTELVAANQVERAHDQITKQTNTALKKAAQVKVPGITKRWTFKVTDLSKVPREWLILDETRVRQEGVAKKGQVEIPGIEFFQEESVSVR
jgi:hypothetical protein